MRGARSTSPRARELDLPELTVIAPGDSRLNAGRTGPAQTITDALISNLPVPNRDFSQLMLLSPQAILSRDGGISIAGQSDRLNGFQIDGATNSDLGGVTGLSGFGTPGSANGVRTLSVEAVRELQIAVAPFDVRYGDFAGGLVNAVTRSGSNRWEGSASSYYQSQALTGKDSAGNRAEDFSRKELTVTIGGPIVNDRAAFFSMPAWSVSSAHAGLPSAPTPQEVRTRWGSASAARRPSASRTFCETPTTWTRARSSPAPAIPRATSSPR